MGSQTKYFSSAISLRLYSLIHYQLSVNSLLHQRIVVRGYPYLNPSRLRTFLPKLTLVYVDLALTFSSSHYFIYQTLISFYFSFTIVHFCVSYQTVSTSRFFFLLSLPSRLNFRSTLWQTGFQVFPRFNFCKDTHPLQDVQGFLFVFVT